VLNTDVLEADCDVLILAGGARQVHAQNVARVTAPIVVECASGAVTESAEHELSINGKVVISNLVASGPWLLRAIAEAEQVGPGSRRNAWIRRMVRDTWRRVGEAARTWNLPVSEAAQGLAVQRVGSTLRAQGLRS